MQAFMESVEKLIGPELQTDLAKLLGINMNHFMENTISENIRTFITNLIGSGVEGNWFYYIAPICLLLLLLFWKKRRVSFAIPVLFIMILILNPIVKEKFEKITETGYYWRLLWIIPIIPLCAALPGMIEEKIKFEYIKGIISIVFAALFILMGSYTYDQRLARFFIPANESKIEQPFVDIADTLLTYDDHPYVVADAWPSVFLRQYSPQIKMLYGRDILGYGVLSDLGSYVYNQLGEGQYSNVASAMLDDGYEYLVTNDSYEGKQKGLEEVGFEFLTRIDTYGIYKLHGIPSVRKERNALGQIVSITCLDENGNPTIGENGYAIITYTYDDDGHIVREFRTDLEGNGVADENGLAGYERAFDSRDRVINEKSIDKRGDLIINKEGYAEIKRTYYGQRLINEEYYDEYGNPINNKNGYARFINEYTWKGELSLTYFYDQSGVLLNMGSSSLHRYFQTLKQKDYIIFIAVKDEAADRMTETLVNDMHELGVQTDLRKKPQYSFYAVITPDGVKEKLSTEALQIEGTIGEIKYSIKSAGLYVGNYSSIVIDEIEYSPNYRGLNIVILENGRVIDSINYDTHTSEMQIHR